MVFVGNSIQRSTANTVTANNEPLIYIEKGRLRSRGLKKIQLLIKITKIERFLIFFYCMRYIILKFLLRCNSIFEFESKTLCYNRVKRDIASSIASCMEFMILEIDYNFKDSLTTNLLATCATFSPPSTSSKIFIFWAMSMTDLFQDFEDLF